MGAQQSVDISCYVEKLTPSPGETVKGCVFLKVEGQPLTSFEGVTISVAGVEYLLVDDIPVPESMGKVINVKHNIFEFYKGMVSVGEHKFSFKLTLPNENSSEMPDSDSAPLLCHSRSSSLDSDGMTKLDSSYSSTASSTTSTSTVSKKIMYKLKASLRRKKNVGITVDTDHWCHAQSVGASQ
jgi:hypothetical protein